MTEKDEQRPLLWIVDSERAPLAAGREAFDSWSDVRYFAAATEDLPWDSPPDAVFFSAEMQGGAEGDAFARLAADAGSVPLLAVARLRSLAQAVAFFRAGAVDYLTLPLEEEEACERFNAAIARTARNALQATMVSLEPVERTPGAVSVTMSLQASPTPETTVEEDILAQLSGETEDTSSPKEEPDPVDGLPVPNLWDELPCGLLLFDSRGNLVFANAPALDMFGRTSLAELQETLESDRASFAAYGTNHKPLPDNQWPQILSAKTRTPRSAIISIESPDRRRIWLRADCMPHLSDGAVSRLSMTLVNLTGELPPLVVAPAAAKGGKPKKSRRRR